MDITALGTQRSEQVRGVAIVSRSSNVTRPTATDDDAGFVADPHLFLVRPPQKNLGGRIWLLNMWAGWPGWLPGYA